MQLRDDIRQTLATEFAFASSKMDASGDLLEMLYYYSALYGAANRALNLEWNRELALVHATLQYTYQEMNALAEGLSRGQKLFSPPDELPKELPKSCTELAELFKSGQTDMAHIYPILGRLAELAYATTGNGRYNYAKGNLKL